MPDGLSILLKNYYIRSEQNDNNNQRKSVIAEELVGLDSIKEDTRYISRVREETAASN